MDGELLTKYRVSSGLHKTDRTYYFAVIGSTECQHQHTLTKCRAMQYSILMESLEKVRKNKADLFYMDAYIYEHTYDANVSVWPKVAEIGYIVLRDKAEYTDYTTNRHYQLHPTGRISKI